MNVYVAVATKWTPWLIMLAFLFSFFCLGLEDSHVPTFWHTVVCSPYPGLGYGAESHPSIGHSLTPDSGDLANVQRSWSSEYRALPCSHEPTTRSFWIIGTEASLCRALLNLKARVPIATLNVGTMRVQEINLKYMVLVSSVLCLCCSQWSSVLGWVCCLVLSQGTDLIAAISWDGIQDLSSKATEPKA